MSKPAPAASMLHPLENPDTLDDLAFQAANAKAAVLEAQADLEEINKRILKLVGVKDEGSFTVTGDHFKVTTTQSITRKVDKAMALDVMRQLPEDIGQAIFDWKPSLNTKLYKDAREMMPQHFEIIARAVTEKPSKPSVKVDMANTEGK